MPNLVEYLLRSAGSFPDKTAVVSKTENATFADLLRAGAAVAEALPSGVDPQPVLIVLDKSVAAVVSCLGTLMNGDFYCPVDVKSPAVRIQSIVDNLEPRVVITSGEFLPLLEEVELGAAEVVRVDEVNPKQEPVEVLRRRFAQVASEQSDLQPAYVVYTSGSTGTPKGVTASHQGLLNYITWISDTFQVTEDDRIGNQAPLHFDVAASDLYLCLATGATLILLPEHLFAFPARLVEALAHHETTMVLWVPSALIKVAELNALDNVDLTALRHVLFCGEVFPAEPLAYWMRSLPGCRFTNLYGPTETTVVCTAHQLKEVPVADVDVPIGRAGRNVTLRVVTSDGREAASNEVGELFVGGCGVALGYYNAPDLTQAAFVQNPLNDRYLERMYRTGDLVRLDAQGVLHFHGRCDHQIKRLGYRIELGEIEAAGTGLEGASQCCALYDADRKEIHLVLVLAGHLDVSDARARLARRLPKYMIPSRYHAVPTMPLTSSGKIDRAHLRERLIRPAAEEVPD